MVRRQSRPPTRLRSSPCRTCCGVTQNCIRWGMLACATIARAMAWAITRWSGFISASIPGGICGEPDTAPEVDTSHNPGLTSSDRPAARQAIDPDKPRPATQQKFRNQMAFPRRLMCILTPFRWLLPPRTSKLRHNGTNGAHREAVHLVRLRHTSPADTSRRHTRLDTGGQAPRHDRSPPPVLGSARTEWGRLP